MNTPASQPVAQPIARRADLPPAGSPPEVESYYEAHRKVYPREVKGRFSNLRNLSVWVLLGFFYVMPWIDWNGRQAILFDLPARKFYLFGLTLWPQDFIFLTWLLVIAALSLFFFTAIGGRLWCGYACPQTVWTEAFLWMERITEGDRSQRMKLDKAPWSGAKLGKKASKQFLWVVFSAWTGFTFVGFFTPIRELAGEVMNFGLGPWETFWTLFYGVATYGNAGFLREQVCKYMCPYARFQSAMFDRDTLIVTYDAERGEQRGGRKKGTDYRANGLGDCTDCTLCVQVCPTGIDIRNGLQSECIACAACIDACDAVMDKMGYPRGLVRYATQHQLEHQKTHVLRPRILIYGALLTLLTIGLVVAVSMRKPVALDALHDRNTLFRNLDSGEVENVYTLKIMNKDERAHRFVVTVEGLQGKPRDTGRADTPQAAADAGRYRLDPARPEFEVASGEVYNAAVRVRADAWDDSGERERDDDHGTASVRFRIEAADDPNIAAAAIARFFSPEK
ncbi:MAG: cytochrome c oxidase accessory protein CcoG [Steroidobacteraceae bacterium]